MNMCKLLANHCKRINDESIHNRMKVTERKVKENDQLHVVQTLVALPGGTPAGEPARLLSCGSSSSNSNARLNTIEKHEEKSISIVMAYINRKAQLLVTLQSIAQSSQVANVDVVIVDDASDPDHVITQMDIEPFSFPIQVISVTKRQKQWSNSCIAYNIGFHFAKSEIVVIQNPEVLHVGDVLGYIQRYMSSDPKAYWAFSCFPSENYIDNNLFAELLNRKGMDLDARVRCIRASIQERNRGLCWYNHPVFYNNGYHFLAATYKTTLNALKGFDERYFAYPFWDDNEFVARAKLICNFKNHNPLHVFGIHQFHGGSGQTMAHLMEYNKKRFEELQLAIETATLNGQPELSSLVEWQLPRKNGKRVTLVSEKALKAVNVVSNRAAAAAAQRKNPFENVIVVNPIDDTKPLTIREYRLQEPHYPRIMHTYWDGSAMSFLSYLTYVTFIKYHPDWEIWVWCPAEPAETGQVVTWTTGEQQLKYTGKDYFPKVFTFSKNVQRRIFNFKQDALPALERAHEVIRSDYLRYWVLYHHGGMWSDTDILYLQSIEQCLKRCGLPKSLSGTGTVDTAVIPRGPYYPVGWFLAPAYSTVFSDILSLAETVPMQGKYQCLGCELLQHYFQQRKFTPVEMKQTQYCNLDIYLPIQSHHIPDIFQADRFPSALRLLTEKCIGLHWFNGSKIAREYQQNFHTTHNSIGCAPPHSLVEHLIQPFLNLV